MLKSSDSGTNFLVPKVNLAPQDWFLEIYGFWKFIVKYFIKKYYMKFNEHIKECHTNQHKLSGTKKIALDTTQDLLAPPVAP